MQEGGSPHPNDKFFWGEMECLAMASYPIYILNRRIIPTDFSQGFFANAPILNALYRRYKSGPASNHLASRSEIGSVRNTENIELCSGDDSREIDFMEALRDPEYVKQPDAAVLVCIKFHLPLL